MKEPGNQTPLKHAVIGIGAGILGAHLPGLQLPTSEVVAGSDIYREPGEARAAELGCAFYLDYQVMLAETEPDVTVVLTPHPSHARLAIAALEAGSHVLVEKPMAVTVAEADDMVAAARANNRLLAINFQHRFRPEVEAARRLIQHGGLGEIQRIEVVEPWLRTLAYYVSAGWRGNWQTEGGGVLLNQAPHGLDMICYLIGMPRRVVAWTRTVRHPIETEDTALAMLEWDSGALGTLFFSTAEAGPRRTTITGSAGILQLGESEMRVQRYATDLRDYIVNSKELYSSPDFEPATVEIGESGGGHLPVYENLHDAILHGASLRADGAQGRMSLELANAIIYSSHTNAAVEFPLDRQAYSDLLARLIAGP